MDCSVVTISGTNGSGRTTIARMLCRELAERECGDYEYFSPGEFRKGLIYSRGMLVRDGRTFSLEEDDRLVDERTIYLMKNERVVVDGIYSAVLCYLNNIDAYHVYLDAPPEVRAARVRERTRKACSAETLLDEETVRVKTGRHRYSIDYRFPALYDAILDTGRLPPEKVLKMLLRGMRVRCRMPGLAAAAIY